jgi:hypothetical protein
MKKFISLTAIAALAFGFAACSSEDDLTPQGQDPQAAAAGTGAYVQFTIDTNSSSLSATSRAETEVTNKSDSYDVLETTGVYKEDLDIEHAVKTVYAYFVKASKDGATYSVNKESKLINLGTSTAPVYYLELNAMVRKPNTDATELSGTNSNISTQYITDVKELTGEEITLGNEYQVYLLCNKPADLTVGGVAITNPTLGDVLDDELELNKTTNNSDNSVTIEDASTTANITANGIPMAARSIDGVIYESFTPTKANTKDNPSQLSFEVERSFARIAYTAPTTTAIPLYAKVADAEDVANGKSATQIGTIEVEGYYVFNRHNEYNTYRHVGSISGSNGTYTATPYGTIIEPKTNNKVLGVYGPMSTQNTSCNFLIDPNSHLKKTGTNNTYDKYNSALARITKYIKWEKSASWNEYVTENSMPNEGQKKGLATGVMFKVKITPSSVVKVDGDTYEDGNSLYYYDGVFYASLKALQTKLPEATVANFRNYNAKYYKNGKAYYTYYIRHINNGDYNVMGDMEFATVRNNSYELSITAAAMNAFETPVSNPDATVDPKDPTDTKPDEDIPDPKDKDDEDYDPDDPDNQNPSGPKPDEDVEDSNSYLQVNVIVRPWIVRSNTVIFGQGF